jgi:hypothetical protein
MPIESCSLFAEDRQPFQSKGKWAPILGIRAVVRQGDSISPLLFNFVADAFNSLYSRARVAGHIQGVVPHLIPSGVTHLQYADDTMILVQKTKTRLVNLKFLLLCFELILGMKIKLHKSEVIMMGAEAEEHARVSRIHNCKQGKFPFIYLGFTMSEHKLSIPDNEPLVAIGGQKGSSLAGEVHVLGCSSNSDRCVPF